MRKPSVGGIPTAIAQRLRSVRYAVGDVFFVIGRALARAGRMLIRIPVAIWRGLTGFWHSLSVIARRRLVAALVIAGGVLALLAFAVPNLPCQFPGGDTCPPPDDAEELVPADALAYLHANLDPDTDQYDAAAELVARLPVLGALAVDSAGGQIPAPGGGALDFEQDVRPWFGGEASIAVVNGTGVIPERVDLLEVEDEQAAADYAAAIAVGQIETTEYEGIQISLDQRDVATAVVNGFLVIGTEDGVEAVIGTATGADGAESLADEATATEVRDELPDHRVAEAWLSPDGVAELIAADTGTLGTLTPLVAPGATRGVAASLSASDDGFELAVRSALDPELEQTSPGFFAAFPPFEPDLPGKLQPETLAYLGMGPPAETVGELLTQASAQAPGIAEGFQELVDRLRRKGDIDLEGDLLGPLGDQAAFTLEPAPGTDPDSLSGALPYLQFVADGVDEDEARAALAALQGSLAEAAADNDEIPPVFGQQQVSGVETSSLRLSPTVELTYAVFDGLVAIATDPAGVAALIEGDGGLDERDLYRRATEDFPDQVSLLAFLDLGGLVAIGEQAGLAEDPRYVTFAGDIRRLDAVGLAVSDQDDVLATDLRLLVGDDQTGDESPPPLPDLVTDPRRDLSNLCAHMTENLGENEYLFTSESVTEGHPDKVADQISDGVLDAVLADDPYGRVACETLVNTGLVVVSGEISTDTYVDIQEIARETIRKIGYTDADLGFSADSCAVINAIDKQSPDIAQGVDNALEKRTDPADDDDLDVAGAGDQGMMFGYATRETPELMPMPISLAHKLAHRLAEVRKGDVVPYLRPDGKTQVTVRYEDGVPIQIEKVLISTQHRDGIDNDTLIRPDLWEHVLHPILPAELYDERELNTKRNFLVNPTGRFVIGGPVGDAGLTGRKIIVDTYGGMARHGGGAFSGKDPSKVDRSAAYAARWVAKNVVAAGLADRCEIQVAYAIGVAHPISVMVETFGTEKLPRAEIVRLVDEHFDLRPGSFREELRLHRPIYQKTAAYGHFGRDDHDFTWERTDRADALREAAGVEQGSAAPA